MGFFPDHLGLYVVTEVIAAGQYRVWPPLRKAVSTNDYATLYPVMAMRLESENSANLPRDARNTSGASMTLVEVFEYDVDTYFGD